MLLGKNPILLPCHKLAEAMNVSAMTISNLRKIAERDGLLEVVEHHNAKRAMRYRFAVERFPILRDRQ